MINAMEFVQNMTDVSELKILMAQTGGVLPSEALHSMTPRQHSDLLLDILRGEFNVVITGTTREIVLPRG
jgi:hypothetical protein